MSATKSLNQEQNRRIVELLHALKSDRDRFRRQEDLATELGVKQGTLSGVLNPKSGKRVGGKILAGLARIAAPELAAIMGGGAVVGGARDKVDALTMAREAAENLANAKLATRDTAWMAMRDVHLANPSVEGFVHEAARFLLNERAPRADESAPGGSPRPPSVDPLGTRYRRRRAAGSR